MTVSSAPESDTTIQSLERVITAMRNERLKHQTAIEELDKAAKVYGISLNGRDSHAKLDTSRTLILAALGGGQLSTSEIIERCSKVSRASIYTMLSVMARKKVITRVELPDGKRGGLYALAGPLTA